MGPARRIIIIIAASLAAGVSGAASALGAAPLGPVSVQVPQHPSTTTDATISFRPRGRLPSGGYYYAVAVLIGYLRGEGEEARPACAVSSNMSKTAYGFPRGGRPVRLVLAPASSAQGGWCAGGAYEGAVYAVPHRPACSKAYPCAGKSTCGLPGGFCGVVVRPPGPYSYPGGLPRPIDRTARIVGHFTLHF